MVFKKKIKFEWEDIFKNKSCGNDLVTSRAKVIGGWIVCTRAALIGNYQATESQSMVFVPDENHQWEV